MTNNYEYGRADSTKTAIMDDIKEWIRIMVFVVYGEK